MQEILTLGQLGLPTGAGGVEIYLIVVPWRMRSCNNQIDLECRELLAFRNATLMRRATGTAWQCGTAAHKARVLNAIIPKSYPPASVVTQFIRRRRSQPEAQAALGKCIAFAD